MALVIHEPESPADAVALLDDLGDAARAYAGGTALLLRPRAGVRYLIDLKSLASLRDVQVQDGALVVGATVTLRALATDPLVRRLIPELSSLPGRIANARVLSAATLGGNLRLVHPRTDPPTLLAALDAHVRCRTPSGERELAVEDLWSLPTALAPTDVITAVAIPIPDRWTAVASARFNPRGWPTANVAVTLRSAGATVGAARVVMAASGGRAARWGAAEDALADQPLDDVEAQLAPPADADLIDDEHGSSEYKRHLLAVLAGRAARAAALELLERGEAR
jgi:carbon-monoxide dehydrogenase medium subunit